MNWVTFLILYPDLHFYDPCKSERLVEADCTHEEGSMGMWRYMVMGRVMRRARLAEKKMARGEPEGGAKPWDTFGSASKFYGQHIRLHVIVVNWTWCMADGHLLLAEVPGFMNNLSDYTSWQWVEQTMINIVTTFSSAGIFYSKFIKLHILAMSTVLTVSKSILNLSTTSQSHGFNVTKIGHHHVNFTAKTCFGQMAV